MALVLRVYVPLKCWPVGGLGGTDFRASGGRVNFQIDGLRGLTGSRWSQIVATYFAVAASQQQQPSATTCNNELSDGPGR